MLHFYPPNKIFNKKLHTIYLTRLIILCTFIFTYLNSYGEIQNLSADKNISIKNIEYFFKIITKNPHPMGSLPQKNLAFELQKLWQQVGIETQLQPFTAIDPTSVKIVKEKKPFVLIDGFNLIGKIKGSSPCAIIFGSHFDSKYFPHINFIGANDGGSSTVLLMELARVAKNTKFSENTLGSCSLYFALFDGEESLLPQWDEAKINYKIQDNLYGSRNFALKNLKIKNKETFIEDNKVKLVFILDMIGHKKQNLFLSKSSNKEYAHLYLSTNPKTKTSMENIQIEDDQNSFEKYSIPILHLIDWTNLKEWHTCDDNLNIISYKKVALLGEDLLRFLKSRPQFLTPIDKALNANN